MTPVRTVRAAEEMGEVFGLVFATWACRGGQSVFPVKARGGRKPVVTYLTGKLAAGSGEALKAEVVAPPVNIMESDRAPGVLGAEMRGESTFRDVITESGSKVSRDWFLIDEEAGNGEHDDGERKQLALGSKGVGNYVELGGTWKQGVGGICVLVTFDMGSCDTFGKSISDVVNHGENIVVGSREGTE